MQSFLGFRLLTISCEEVRAGEPLLSLSRLLVRFAKGWRLLFLGNGHDVMILDFRCVSMSKA